jgi:hypothetical protein
MEEQKPTMRGYDLAMKLVEDARRQCSGSKTVLGGASNNTDVRDVTAAVSAYDYHEYIGFKGVRLQLPHAVYHFFG